TRGRFSRGHRIGQERSPFVAWRERSGTSGAPQSVWFRMRIAEDRQAGCQGTPWERIVLAWRGKVPMEAITEAVKLGQLKANESGGGSTADFANGRRWRQEVRIQ